MYCWKQVVTHTVYQNVLTTKRHFETIEIVFRNNTDMRRDQRNGRSALGLR